jgi:lauroyl/myristoyl acyltransferase
LYEWIGKLTENPQLIKRWAWWCGWLPRPFMLVVCRLAAMFLHVIAGRVQRERIEANLRDLLKDCSNAEAQRIRRQFFQNLVITLYEIILESHRLPGSEGWRFRVDGESHLEEALRLGRGAIVYAPHEGNFFYYYWYLCQKYPCLTIATAGSQELRPLYLHFQSMGCSGMDYDSTPPLEMMRKLKKHLAANGVVFILGDFWRPTFPQSRFFGRVTRTPEGAALLSIEQQVPVIPFYGRRERGFRHHLIFEQPLHLYASYPRTQRAEATHLLNRFMEWVIRKHPEQWFYWFNVEERWEREKEPAESHTA